MENILPDERYLFIQDLSNLVTHLEQGYKSTSEDWNKCEGVLTKLYESTKTYHKALQECKSNLDSISNNARLEDLLKIKKSALDSIVQVLLPISEFVTSLQSNQDKVTKARKQREQILPMLSDDVKSLSSLIGEHTSRTTLMLSLVTAEDDYKREKIHLEYMGHMPVKPQDIKTQEKKLVTCQQKIEEVRKSLQTKTTKFEKKFGESISRCGLDLRKVLSFGFEYSRIITDTYKEASGFFKSKVQQKIGLLSDEDDEIPDGMRTPKLSPRSSEKGLLSGFPLGWFDLPWPVKPIEQEFEEFEQKYGLGKVHQETCNRMKVASQKFAEMLDPIETSKIRAYIHILLSDNPQNLAKETQIISQLESDMNRKMYDDNYVGFFLTTLSYYLNCHNRTVFHMHESKLGSLKAKFLDMQIALDQRDIKPDNIPLMLNLSIRTGKISAAPTDLPFTSQFEVQKIPSMLISELRSNFLEDYNIWQDYFVKNVNNKFEIQLSETPTNALKKTFGVIGSLFTKKPTKKMELLKQVEARKDYYKSAISEIGMMLCNLQMDAWKAISILKQLSETFDIDTSSLEHIYQIFRSITAERVEKEAFKTVWTKRNSILQSLESKRAGSSRLPAIFERVLPYLDHRSISELFRLNKQVSRDFGLTLSINQMNSLSNLNVPSESRPKLYMKIINLKLNSKQTTQRILQNMRTQGNSLKRLEDCKLTKYSMGLLENDAKRTSSAPETVASIKVVLANTLVYYQDTVGYVQGMNYMVLYFLELWKDEFLAFKAMLLVLDEFYMPFYIEDLHYKPKKDQPVVADPKTFDILALHSVADRIIEMKFKHVSYALKRNSVSALNFCTGQLLTLFTGTFTSGASHIFLDRVFECLLQHGWPGAFHLVGMILGGILELVEVCTHEKLNVIWNAILRPSFLDIMLSHAEIVDAVEKPDDKEEESLTKSALVRLKYQSLLDVGESQGKALLGDCMHLVKWDKLRHTLQTMFGKVAHSNWMPTSQTVEVYIQEYLQVQKKVRQNAPS